MRVFPAIDILDGKAVRLLRGSYNDVTVYSEDIPALAASFRAAGAEVLHVVDLAGARDGNAPALDTVRRLVASTPLAVEIGGGIRDERRVAAYLEAGVYRVVLGTAAAQQPEFCRDMAMRYKDRIVCGCDLRDGFVAVRGWTEKTGERAEAFFSRMAEYGVKAVICTDVSCDGALLGPNTELYRSLVASFGRSARPDGMEIVASGGVSCAADISGLALAGADGVIVGKALYENRLTLADALKAAKTACGA